MVGNIWRESGHFMIKTTCNYLTGIIIKRGSRVVSPKFLGLQAVCQSRLARLGVSNDAAF